MTKFWKRQCEIARTMMKSEVTDEYIQKEYNKIPVDEWDEMCIQVDTLLKKHNAPINDRRWNKMIEDFVVVAAMNGVNETVLYIAFMEWISKKENK